MHAMFVMLRVEPGHLYEVTDQIARLEVASEMYSIVGDYDLLLKIYVTDLAELGDVVTRRLHAIKHIRETKTIVTFATFAIPPNAHR
jgi:DNA-binding Lrp family transcriptional regulator